jgi:NADP-dependent 3-hydroxy acid dehydrogenase YdfG
MGSRPCCPACEPESPATLSTSRRLADTRFGRTAPFTGTKFAVLAISESLRLENPNVLVTVISPGVVESELADTISDESARAAMKEFRKVALTPDAIGRTVLYAIEQPPDVGVNEIIVRPTSGAQ